MTETNPQPEKKEQPTAGQSGQFVFELPADLQAHYVNNARISHSPMELVIARLLPGQTRAQVLSRIVFSPVGAKMFLRALADNVARYEASYGEIPLPGPSPLADALFRKRDE